jgi:hypothetical protein
MITPDGFFDWGIRDPGPDDRWAHQGYRRTPMTAITHHSIEGWFAWVAGHGGYSPMRDPTRFPTAYHWQVVRFEREVDGRQVLNGDLVQHYPVFAWLQHGHSANELGPGGESEDGGVPGLDLRLTPEQEDTWLRIHADMREFTGIDYTRVPGSKVGLVEHREMGGTQCPSDFYNGLWERIAKGDDDMTDDELKAALKRIGWADDVGPIDRRLRNVQAARNQLENLSSDPDSPDVLMAVQVLEREGVL